MRKTLVAVAAGVLVVGGAAVATAQTEDDDVFQRWGDRIGSVVEDVLDDLVGDGTLEEDQKTAILDALEERHQQFQTEREALREERRAMRDQLREFWEDGKLDADELAQLPDGPLTDPDGPLGEYLDDGELTREELREGHGGFFRGRRHGFGHRGGGFFAPEDTGA